MGDVIFATSLGLSDYREAWRLQHTFHAHCRTTEDNVLLLTEHYPVVTLGHRRPYEQLLLFAADLVEKGIRLVTSERGGGATYHGPGQLTAYPIFSTLLRRYGIKEFVVRLEEVMRRVSQDFGVPATQRFGLPGLWVGERKMGAIGIAVRRGTSLHGFALNVNVDLRPFSYIVPCGLTGKGVTSLAQETREEVTMQAVVEQVRQAFQVIFAVPVKEMTDGWSYPNVLSINNSYNSEPALLLGHATTWVGSGSESKVCGVGSRAGRAQPPFVGGGRSASPGVGWSDAAGKGHWDVAQYSLPGKAGAGAKGRSCRARG